MSTEPFTKNNKISLHVFVIFFYILTKRKKHNYNSIEDDQFQFLTFNGKIKSGIFST